MLKHTQIIPASFVHNIIEVVIKTNTSFKELREYYTVYSDYYRLFTEFGAYDVNQEKNLLQKVHRYGWALFIYARGLFYLSLELTPMTPDLKRCMVIYCAAFVASQMTLNATSFSHVIGVLILSESSRTAILMEDEFISLATDLNRPWWNESAKILSLLVKLGHITHTAASELSLEFVNFLNICKQMQGLGSDEPDQMGTGQFWKTYLNAFETEGYIDSNLVKLNSALENAAEHNKNQLGWTLFTPTARCTMLDAPRNFKTPFKTGAKSAIRKLFHAPIGSGIGVQMAATPWSLNDVTPIICNPHCREELSTFITVQSINPSEYLNNLNPDSEISKDVTNRLGNIISKSISI